MGRGGWYDYSFTLSNALAALLMSRRWLSEVSIAFLSRETLPSKRTLPSAFNTLSGWSRSTSLSLSRKVISVTFFESRVMVFPATLAVISWSLTGCSL